jgi:integrase
LGSGHYQDHETLTRAGGESAKRGTRGRGATIAGPLHPLTAMRLQELTAPVIEAWAAREAKTRPTSARLAWRLLRAFMAWCAEHPDYGAIVPDHNPAKTRRAREALGKAGVKQDALLKEQLPAWFATVRAIGNPAISAYLQTLLLTGARPGEVLTMRWEDVNTQWRGLTIHDKVEGERVIPLTPYVHHLLAALPRRGSWVFSSGARLPGKAAQPIAKPHHAHASACSVAAIEGLTLHGLRRSFKSLTEWLEIPAGVVAQIQEHKPSATAEKHYTVRPLDLLRLHHERIEAWILEQAGAAFDAKAEPGRLRVVA